MLQIEEPAGDAMVLENFTLLFPLEEAIGMIALPVHVENIPPKLFCHGWMSEELAPNFLSSNWGNCPVGQKTASVHLWKADKPYGCRVP